MRIVSSDLRATSRPAEIEHERDADEAGGDVEHRVGVALLIARTRQDVGQGADLRPGLAQAVDFERREIDIAGAQIAGRDAVMAHRAPRPRG